MNKRGDLDQGKIYWTASTTYVIGNSKEGHKEHKTNGRKAEYGLRKSSPIVVRRNFGGTNL